MALWVLPTLEFCRRGPRCNYTSSDSDLQIKQELIRVIHPTNLWNHSSWLKSSAVWPPFSRAKGLFLRYQGCSDVDLSKEHLSVRGFSLRDKHLVEMTGKEGGTKSFSLLFYVWNVVFKGDSVGGCSFSRRMNEIRRQGSVWRSVALPAFSRTVGRSTFSHNTVCSPFFAFFFNHSCSQLFCHFQLRTSHKSLPPPASRVLVLTTNQSK